MRTNTHRRARAAGAALTLVISAAGVGVAHAAPPYPSDAAKPQLIPLLNGFDQLWKSSGANDLHGKVKDPATLSRNDELTVWINHHATGKQRFRALQDSEYDNATSTLYDQSYAEADGLGSVLGPLYVQGRRSGALPKVNALINSSTGTTGAYVSTGDAKAHFSYPRPYLPTDPNATPVQGDAAGCAPSVVNASSLKGIRVGRSYADAKGNLKIQRVPDATDQTHELSRTDVPLSPGYGTTGICTGGSFPSGHTTTAYQASITLATLLPELAPSILARGSEGGNNRIVLGVHYPLDIIGGRIDGEVALATRWQDKAFRKEVLRPARRELVGYLEGRCGGTLARCIADQAPYQDNPFNGDELPGGTAQVVYDRASALKVFEERLTYGFSPIGSTKRAPSVPKGAEGLLRTAYPGLTDAQRRAVLAQTEIRSGYPLDGTGTEGGSWQRIDLAAAMSAGVKVARDGSVAVTSVGGLPRVTQARGAYGHRAHRRGVRRLRLQQRRLVVRR